MSEKKDFVNIQIAQQITVLWNYGKFNLAREKPVACILRKSQLTFHILSYFEALLRIKKKDFYFSSHMFVV